MGCGKSKHDVASENTILKSKKSSIDDSKVVQENGTETIDAESNSKLEHNKSHENVKEVVDESNVVAVAAPDEITNVQQDKALEKNKEVDVVADNKTEEIVVADEKEVSLENNNNQKEAVEEEKLIENEKEEETLVKEIVKDMNHEETLVKEETLIKEEETNETNVLISEGEQKDLKADKQGQ